MMSRWGQDDVSEMHFCIKNVVELMLRCGQYDVKDAVKMMSRWDQYDVKEIYSCILNVVNLMSR